MKLNLSCIDISIGDLIQCSFGLSRQELNIFLNLLNETGWVSISSIAKAAKRDRSVVQRALLSLNSKELVERDHKNLARGGYEYLYRAKDKKTVKKAILEKSRSFSLMIQNQIDQW
jgi:predicted transcriptional regulator